MILAKYKDQPLELQKELADKFPMIPSLKEVAEYLREVLNENYKAHVTEATKEIRTTTTPTTSTTAYFNLYLSFLIVAILNF